MRLVNLTPHAVSMANAAGEIIATIPPSGTVARVSSTPGGFFDWLVEGECPIAVHNAPVWGEVEGLPDPQEDTLFVVSALVGGRISAARVAVGDVLCLGTGPNDDPVRRDGRIVAVRRFVRAGGAA